MSLGEKRSVEGGMTLLRAWTGFEPLQETVLRVSQRTGGELWN